MYLFTRSCPCPPSASWVPTGPRCPAGRSAARPARGQVSGMMTGQVSGVRYDDKSGAHLGKEGCGELLLVPGQAYPYLQVI